MIIQDEKFLRQISVPATLDEAKEIAEKLFVELLQCKDTDVGLAAPQIGILKQVCVIRAMKPIVLVNPRIVSAEGETWYQEGCLSFPGASVRTRRHTDIVVKVDYLGVGTEVIQEWKEDVELAFSGDGFHQIEEDMALLECVAVQHEVDHLSGVLFFDREWKNEPVKAKKKYSPNERIDIIHLGTKDRLERIKYKKYVKDYEPGGWKIDG